MAVAATKGFVRMTGETELLTISQELAEVSRLVEDDDVTGALGRFAERVLRTVPGCAAVTVTMTGARAEQADVVAACATPGAAAPTQDMLTGDGPLVEALRYREPRRVDDTHTDQRWPRFSARLAEHGYRSVLVLPVPTRRCGGSGGSAVLTVFSDEPHRFDETVHDVALLLTVHAGVVFDNAQLFHDSRRLVDHLKVALETRQTIGQAQGLLMRHFGCDAQGGFHLLKGASQNTNTKLRDVAEMLVSAHEQDTFDSALTKFRLDATTAGAATS
ncbi:response regulator [Prauserella sp. PE36]|uniref:GAF and ANTAR domain-containing protein n=4 Tax=Pseudonocardiaceae TaxID=2070 RepID=A0A8E2BAF5_9PSEU|nr:GAF and ANTAR domain-containing protein [Prauserella sp. PE36]AXB46090.1 response regulator [Amycolatopsis albispora]MBB2506447.1 GAF and ANTAR domain-containing protein [Amycolatopsis echigonensis]PXY25589.1 response regulator [Prauserella flavalba]RBM22322.1 response regulator [Prauserella sp. PE36]